MIKTQGCTGVGPGILFLKLSQVFSFLKPMTMCIVQKKITDKSCLSSLQIKTKNTFLIRKKEMKILHITAEGLPLFKEDLDILYTQQRIVKKTRTGYQPFEFTE